MAEAKKTFTRRTSDSTHPRRNTWVTSNTHRHLRARELAFPRETGGQRLAFSLVPQSVPAPPPISLFRRSHALSGVR